MTPTALALRPGEVGLFGYGSLLSKRSMERTLQRAYTGPRHPCTLRGWRRTWDSFYPNERFYFERLPGERRYPQSILYLNIQPAGTDLNGVVYVISHDDLAGFDAREATYDRVKVEPIDLHVTGGPVYVYVGKSEFVLRAPVTVDHAAVRASYLDIVEQGLTELGPAFRLGYEASSDEPPAANIIRDLTD